MVNSNAKNLLRQMLSSGGTVGLLEAKDVGGNTRYIADYGAFPAVVEDDFTLTAANAGISVGSGSTAATDTDYQLVTPITSGLTGTVTTDKSVDGSGNVSIDFTVTLQNTSGSSISVSEICYKQEISASDSFEGTTATDRVFLLDRSVFDTVTIAAGSSAVIDYRIKAVVTNSGGVEGTKNITVNGTYNALDDDLDGYSSVTVNVSGGGSYSQINPFPSGASSVTAYSRNGVTITSSSIDANGTADIYLDEASAGYEGIVFEFNVTAGKQYKVEFDYQNADALYFSGYVIGFTVDNKARTHYDIYGDWPNNLPRDSSVHSHTAVILAEGSTIYLCFNLCGYNDSRTNKLEITNLKVYELQ